MSIKLQLTLGAIMAMLIGVAFGAEPRKDAAEVVQEGSVANWMEYYKRERVAPSPSESSKPAVQTEKPASPPAR